MYILQRLKIQLVNISDDISSVTYHSIILSLLLFGSGLSPAAAIDSSELFDALQKNRVPILSQAVYQNLANFVEQSTSLVVQDGLERLLEQERKVEFKHLRKIARRIRIDGRPRDWKRSNFLSLDQDDNWSPIDPRRRIKKKRKEFDLISFGSVINSRYLYVQIKPRRMPQGIEHYHAVNLMDNRGRLFYTITWTRSGCYLYEFHPRSHEFMGATKPVGMQSAAGRVFEARVPIRALKNLPDYYQVGSIAWDEDYNAYNNIWSYTPQAHLHEIYRNYALELFARYADNITLTPNDPLPLAQALADAYLYRMGTEAVRDLVIVDGLAMLDMAKQSEEYVFPGQRPLAQMSLDQLLVWSNRATLYGVENNAWRFRKILSKTGGKLTEEIYRFLFLDPAALQEARSLIELYNLIVPGDLSATLRNIEETVIARQYYRADLDFLERLATILDSDYWWGIYGDARYEQDHDLNVITTVEGVPIYKHRNWSSSFQTRYFAEHGNHYGNCGDVTGLSLVIAKALGIPGLHIHYDLVGDGYYQVVHSFPAYYDSAQELYVGFRSGDNQVWDWAKSGRDDLQVFFSYDMPIQEWCSQAYSRLLPGVKAWGASNYKTKVITLVEWNNFNLNGFPAP